jgi:hypothetical protein
MGFARRMLTHLGILCLLGCAQVYSNKNLAKTQETFERQQSLWRMIARWNEQTERWMSEDFTKVSDLSRSDTYPTHVTVDINMYAAQILVPAFRLLVGSERRAEIV